MYMLLFCTRVAQCTGLLSVPFIKKYRKAMLYPMFYRLFIFKYFKLTVYSKVDFVDILDIP